MAQEDAGKPEHNEQADDKAQPAEQQSGVGTETGAGADVDSLIEAAVAAALVEQQDTVLRAQAEVQNMRRRCEQDVEKAHKFALEKFSGELLPVIDNLERALQAVTDSEHESVKALYEGVELTLKGFIDVLSKHAIEQINPEGEPFDPQLHQAMSTLVNDEVEPNTVLTVVQKGYLLNGRVIRPAMVLVAKASG